MKRIILTLGLFIAGTSLSHLAPTSLGLNGFALKADIISNNINLIEKLSKEQDFIADIVELYMERYGVVPTYNELKDSRLLDYDFDFSGTFVADNHTITLNTTLPNTEAYQVDYYKNNFSRNRVAVPSVSGNSFQTRYYLGKEALKTISYEGVVDYIEPSAPESTTQGKSWYDTSMKRILYYNNGWVTLDAKRLFIVKAVSELPTTATAIENDAGIVSNPTTLEKYIYSSSAWHKIDNIPFNYNTGF